MFSECEHNCLLKIARDCKHRGMSRTEAQSQIERDFGGFSTSFRIAQAVSRAFSANADHAIYA